MLFETIFNGCLFFMDRWRKKSTHRDIIVDWWFRNKNQQRCKYKDRPQRTKSRIWLTPEQLESRQIKLKGLESPVSITIFVMPCIEAVIHNVSKCSSLVIISRLLAILATWVSCSQRLPNYLAFEFEHKGRYNVLISFFLLIPSKLFVIWFIWSLLLH